MKKCIKCNKEKNELDFRNIFDKRVNKNYKLNICKQCEKEYSLRYNKENRDKRKNSNKKYIDKNKNSIDFDIRQKIIKSTYNSFKRQNQVKSVVKSEEILGCSLDYAVNYLKNKYKERYNKEYELSKNLDIDHIIPLSLAKNENETIKLCHYTNLQILEHSENLKKGNKIN